MIHPRKREFLALFKQTGWSQAELARKLELTPGGVSGLIKGGTIPSAGLLKLLRLVISSEQPEALQAARSAIRPSEAEDRPVNELLGALAGVGDKERAELLAQFAGIARTFSRRRASSGAGAAASRALRGAASASAGAAAVARTARPASTTGSTTAATSGKKRAVPRRQAVKVSPAVPGPK